MKERPIIFSRPMVRSILGLPYGPIKRDCKTQTRRLVRARTVVACPYGQKGDRLWVRECFGVCGDYGASRPRLVYRADYPEGWPASRVLPEGFRWRPSIHMPRSASRINLELTAEPRLQLLGNMTEAEARAEGLGFDPGTKIWFVDGYTGDGWLKVYVALWNSIHGRSSEGSWMPDRLVWALEFKRLDAPEAAGIERLNRLETEFDEIDRKSRLEAHLSGLTHLL